MEPAQQVQSEQVQQVQSEQVQQVQSEPSTQVQSEPTIQVQSEPTTQVQSEPTTQVQSEPIQQVQSEPTTQNVVTSNQDDQTNSNNLTLNIVTKKYANENKQDCCAIKKFGPKIGTISNSNNVAALDYIFVECNDKIELSNKIKNVKFPPNIMLNKSNLNNLINI